MSHYSVRRMCVPWSTRRTCHPWLKARLTNKQGDIYLHLLTPFLSNPDFDYLFFTLRSLCFFLLDLSGYRDSFNISRNTPPSSTIELRLFSALLLVMLRLPLQFARSALKRSSSSLPKSSGSSSVSNCTRVDQLDNGCSSSAGRWRQSDKLSAVVQKGSQTSQAEQLARLAKSSLVSSAAHKDTSIRDSATANATSDHLDGRQARSITGSSATEWEGITIWPYLW